jgi:flagellar biosynthesis protein FliP
VEFFISMLTAATIRFFDPLVALIIGVFSRHIASLSILRYGLGLNGFGFGIVTVGLACLLTAVVVDPMIQDTSPANGAIVQEFTVTHTDEKVLSRIEALVTKTQPSQKNASKEQETKKGSDRIASLAFVISQLSTAFRLWIFFLVPFFIVDLLVVSIIGALGVQGLRHEVVSVPLKIALFVAVDGWTLIVEKLLTGTL